MRCPGAPPLNLHRAPLRQVDVVRREAIIPGKMIAFDGCRTRALRVVASRLRPVVRPTTRTTSSSRPLVTRRLSYGPPARVHSSLLDSSAASTANRLVGTGMPLQVVDVKLFARRHRCGQIGPGCTPVAYCHFEQVDVSWLQLCAPQA